jgi:hypothetical protein
VRLDTIQKMTLLANEVMKKVRTVFLLRRLAAPFVVCAAALAIVASTVSVGNVIANMPDLFDIQAVLKFFVAAFAHTDIVIKCALVAGLAFFMVTLKGLVESVRLSSYEKA